MVGKKQVEGPAPGRPVVNDYNEILTDSEIELVIINSPDHLHHEMAIKALKHGKHIVVEKPFTLTVKEADEIIARPLKKG
jgi:scyllo-inositol 2-dehydrogenase (NADP+)